jgi:ketosteroid isomerase-like protein
MAMTKRLETEPKLYLDTAQPIVKDALTPTASTRNPRYQNPAETMTPLLKAAVIPPADQPSKSARMITRALHTSTPVDPSGTQRNAPNIPVASARSSADPMLLAQALPPIVTEPKGLDRPEIDQLLDEYVDAYEKADVERLMATLSTRVREKGTMDYQAIRNAYIKGFTGRDQFIYRLKNVQIDIKGEQATVIAQYLISARVVAQNAKLTTVSGRIEWKLHREGDKLKIVAINY